MPMRQKASTFLGGTARINHLFSFQTSQGWHEKIPKRLQLGTSKHSSTDNIWLKHRSLMIQAKSVKNLHNSNSSIHLVDEVLLLIFFFLERG
jgi:hypothetical protein